MKAQIYLPIIIMETRHIHKILPTQPPSPLLGFAHFVEMLKREHVATMRERGLASKLPQAVSNKESCFMFTFVTTKLCIFVLVVYC